MKYNFEIVFRPESSFTSFSTSFENCNGTGKAFADGRERSLSESVSMLAIIGPLNVLGTPTEAVPSVEEARRRNRCVRGACCQP